MNIREHHVIGAAVLALIITFLWAGEASAQKWTGNIKYPEVITHPKGKTLIEVTAICEESVNQDEVPCAVVTIDERVCFAYMDEYGHADTVNCFPLLNEESE